MTAAGDASVGGDASEPEWRHLNRAAWDDRVKLHVNSEFYDVDGFVAGASSLKRFELLEMGAVAGRDLVHLQCHFGLDTLSWARLGANVTGLDFSAPAMAAATELAARGGLDANFVTADVYDAADVLGDERFDIVYTGLGALVWLPDVVRWAQVVARLLRPGGFVYLAEMHPFTETLADDDLYVAHDYFTIAEGSRWEESGSYVDRKAHTLANTTVQWTHPIGSVVTALIDAGLRLEFLHEHDHTVYERWPFLQRAGDGTWRLPPDTPRIPLLYSLKAHRPA
jgi:2-polyprenyl-3-methyl-5-hydroxy-6-metoxy-1,4-benzoquinol methylase